MVLQTGSEGLYVCVHMSDHLPFPRIYTSHRVMERTHEVPSNEVPRIILGYHQGRLATYLLCCCTLNGQVAKPQTTPCRLFLPFPVCQCLASVYSQMESSKHSVFQVGCVNVIKIQKRVNLNSKASAQHPASVCMAMRALEDRIGQSHSFEPMADTWSF